MGNTLQQNNLTRSVIGGSTATSNSVAALTKNYVSQHSSYWSSGTRGNTLKRLSSSTLGLTNANAYELSTPPAKQSSNLNFASYSHIMSDMTKRRLRSANNSPVRATPVVNNATSMRNATTIAASTTSPKRANLLKISPSHSIGNFVSKSTRSRSDLAPLNASTSNNSHKKSSIASMSATRNSNLPTRVINATHRVHPQQQQMTPNTQPLFVANGSSNSYLRQPRSYTNHQLPLNVLAMSSARLLQGAAAGSGSYLRSTNHL